MLAMIQACTVCGGGQRRVSEPAAMKTHHRTGQGTQPCVVSGCKTSKHDSHSKHVPFTQCNCSQHQHGFIPAKPRHALPQQSSLTLKAITLLHGQKTKPTCCSLAPSSTPRVGLPASPLFSIMTIYLSRCSNLYFDGQQVP